MKAHAALAARILLGLIYVVFGLNGFLNFLPMPDSVPEKAMAFSIAMMSTGYFFPLVKGTEVLMGALLLSGFAAPLALVVLAPVTINIFLFHLFLTPGMSNQIMPIAMCVLHALAATAYWHHYRPLFGRGTSK